jgi:hypothetical protein
VETFLNDLVLAAAVVGLGAEPGDARASNAMALIFNSASAFASSIAFWIVLRRRTFVRRSGPRERRS